MSTKRGPSRSSLGPLSADVPVRFRWSAMATISPGVNAGSIATRGVGDDQVSHAERGGDAHAEADLRGG